ncbi:nuclear transport factor 2 family protein [Phyllobacterium sp. 21LDTY02-6]|uniref:nuclear transport factor 2 family protein n=1 Tax=unclassified Phyllobacterium TaxID=2638441 RepID=UPI002022747D|nr:MULTISPECIES: nuclear transport factor 2 family protein [unclassified Phyllobacterium]MCO4318854.1 nuclear transport factor 2 family protein [Phyllobacterium sp. 21LDTY02-6]MCX8278932.1 nuclear transport factor 2 family protein [Phyllobacterium sp. 0TCS1.6C]MCX8293716.1 nuclear transport factor 2 family protein [Phyllobacterium sp. 0TCS1.6A]
MQTSDTAEIMRRFNQAFRDHTPETLRGLIAPDCVMESIQPAPNGTRYEGHDACLAFWEALANDPVAHFDVEDTITMGDRAIIRWRFNFGAGDSVRGVNLMHVRDGLIVEALGYSKIPGLSTPLPE